MHGLMEKRRATSCKRRPRAAADARVTCESLEQRSLLAGGLGFPGALMGKIEFSRGADLGSLQAGRQGGFFGGGSLGLGGGMRDPILLLTAPLLEGGSGSTTPPSPSVFSNSAVQQALKTLQSDLSTDVPSGARPTHESVGALEDDLDAIRKGTLSGTAAQTKIQSDQAAILSSMGLTQAQVTQIQSDQSALQTAIQTATTAASSSTTSTTASSSTSTTASASSGSAIQTALQTLQSDLNTDNPNSTQPTHASVGAVEDDLDAIRKGTLSGSAAVTQVQTDTAAVLSSMGLTSAQITQIQSDQAAVETAIQSNASSSTASSSTASSSTASSSTSTTSSSTTESALQSVSQYLVGLPGLSGFGMRGFGSPGMGFGGTARGGFMSWR